MKDLFNVFSFLTYSEKRRFFFVLLVVIFLSLIEVAGVASVVPFLTVLARPEAIAESELLSHLFVLMQKLGVTRHTDFLAALGLLAFCVVILAAMFRAFSVFVVNQFIEMQRHILSKRLLSKIVGQDYEYFLINNSSEAIKVILADVDQFTVQVLRPTTLMISHFIVLVALISLVILYNPYLALGIFGVFGVIYVSIYSSLKNNFERMGHDKIRSNSLRFQLVTEALNSIKELKFFNSERHYVESFEKPSLRFSLVQAKLNTLTHIPQYFVEAIAFGGILGLASYLLYANDGEALDKVLPLLGLYAFTAYRMQPSLRSVYQGWVSLRHGRAIISSLNKHDNTPVYRSSHNVTSRLPDSEEVAVEFNSVSYKYPGSGRMALTDVSFTIAKGSSVAIVGKSGAGKTTLVDLLLGLLQPTEGFIARGFDKLEGQGSNKLSVGYVPQDVRLVNKSVAENIAFGSTKNDLNYDAIEAAAKLARLDQFVSDKLPAGYESYLGENGVTLSGGERQRIGIARALYNMPEVLIFDEATSALDSTTERQVVASINALMGARTILVVAHREETIKKCQFVMQLENGHLKAFGTIKDYFEKTGVFATDI